MVRLINVDHTRNTCLQYKNLTIQTIISKIAFFVPLCPPLVGENRDYRDYREYCLGHDVWYGGKYSTFPDDVGDGFLVGTKLDVSRRESPPI